MGGVFSVAAVERAAELACHLALHDEQQLEQFMQARPRVKLPVWIKVNTGMNRLGVAAEAVAGFMRRLDACPHVAGSPGLMSHLANADDLSDAFSVRQNEQLRRLQDARRQPLCLANSAGVLGWTPTHTDWVRPGIMLYGVSPFQNECGSERGLRPVMSLQASVIAVDTCKAGARVGYGGSYQCPEDMPVAVLGIGYGDGYPRHAPSGAPVLINGQRAALIGRVSMDMISVDLRSLGPVRVGDPAILWGEGLPVEEIAQAAGTIAYELLTGVTARVRRLHIHH
jgi:alanine racemase